jgi:hypothetical protein
MPSSGWGVEDVSEKEFELFEQRWKRVVKEGMEREWLGSLVAALHAGADLDSATWAGIEEWDL